MVQQAKILFVPNNRLSLGCMPHPILHNYDFDAGLKLERRFLKFCVLDSQLIPACVDSEV